MDRKGLDAGDISGLSQESIDMNENKCEFAEYYTDAGCATCQDAFPNCQKCFTFTGTSDGSDLYNTPIYQSPNDMTVTSYWACKTCMSDFELDFYS